MKHVLFAGLLPSGFVALAQKAAPGQRGHCGHQETSQKSGVKHYFIVDESSRSMEQMSDSLAFLSGLK